MWRRTFVLLGVGCLLAVGGLVWLLTAREVGAAAPPAAELSGKPVLVVAKDGINVHLEKPEIRHLGGRTFVVGKEVEGSTFVKARFDGATVWVPLESITQIVELDGGRKE